MFDIDHKNEELEEKSADYILKWAILDEFKGEVAVSSSFGIGSAALLHMVSCVDKAVKVVFVNTGCHFRETIEYKESLVKQLGLTNVVEYAPLEEEVGRLDPDGKLYAADPDLCCKIRKVKPMKRSIEGLKAWISGIMRSQSEMRKNTRVVEKYNGNLYKVNPLVRWTSKDIYYYLENNNLPRHPLFEKGYPSVGCEPCTFLPTDENDERSGRWAGKAKTECGIHTYMFHI